MHPKGPANSRLPTGKVTFLFTDIEGSTQLWEERPVPMQAALARHDADLRRAIESNGGCIVKSLGDGVCAVFDAAHQGKFDEEQFPVSSRSRQHAGIAVAVDPRQRQQSGKAIGWWRRSRCRRVGVCCRLSCRAPTCTTHSP